MERSLDKFDFDATVRTVGEAIVSVICHILFDFALVGIGVAAVLATCAYFLGKRKHHFTQPFFVVARRVSTACLALAIPGLVCLLLTGRLPESGVYINFSFGFLVLWTMVTIYLCAEQINFEWFIKTDSGGPDGVEGAEAPEDAALESQSVLSNEQLQSQDHVIETTQKTTANR